jgi:Fe-S-cluster containining protein
MDEARYLELMAQLRRQAEILTEQEKVIDETIDAFLAILKETGTLNDGQLLLLARARTGAAPALPYDIADEEDKYAVENSEVDCAARMHLCHGRCCRFHIRLSRQDVEEQQLQFDIDRPYALAKNAEGYCVYQTRETGFCGTYQNRPAPCRRYTCAEDKRIWIDFEKMIPAPMPNGLVPIRRKVPGDGG